MEKRKENGKKGKKRIEGKREKGRNASAPTAASGRAWPTVGRAARDGTAARKKRKGLVGALKSDDRTAGELGED